jgi:hypothetical protein
VDSLRRFARHQITHTAGGYDDVRGFTEAHGRHGRGANLLGQGGCRTTWPEPIMARSEGSSRPIHQRGRHCGQPLRTLGGTEDLLLEDIAMCCYRNGWFSMDTAGGMANRDEPDSARSSTFGSFS